MEINNIAMRLQILETDLEAGKGVLPIMACTGRLRAKGVPFSGFGYIKG